MEKGGREGGDSSSSSSLDSDVHEETEHVDLDHVALQKQVEALDTEYSELQVQEESLRRVLQKLQKDQSCLEAGVLELGEPGTKSHPINKNKRANVDNEEDDNEVEAIRKLRQALMEESSCSGSEDDDERVTTAGLGDSMEV